MSPFHIRLNCPLPPILFLAPVVCEAEERTEDPKEMRMFSLGITTTLRKDDICFPFGLMLSSSFFPVCFTRKKRLYSARGVSTGEKSRSEIGKVSEASFSPFFSRGLQLRFRLSIALSVGTLTISRGLKGQYCKLAYCSRPPSETNYTYRESWNREKRPLSLSYPFALFLSVPKKIE